MSTRFSFWLGRIVTALALFGVVVLLETSAQGREPSAERVEVILEKLVCQKQNETTDDEIFYAAAAVDGVGEGSAISGPSTTERGNTDGNTAWSMSSGLKGNFIKLNIRVASINVAKGQQGRFSFALIEADGVGAKEGTKIAGSLLQICRDPKIIAVGGALETASSILPSDSNDCLGVLVREVHNLGGGDIQLRPAKIGNDEAEGHDAEFKMQGKSHFQVRFTGEDADYLAEFSLRYIKGTDESAAEPNDKKPLASDSPKLPIPMGAAAIDLSTVRGKQQALVALGYDVGKVDGLDGPKTQAAAKKFQLDHGIEVVGKLGPKTTAKLRELLKEKNIPFKN